MYSGSNLESHSSQSATASLIKLSPVKTGARIENASIVSIYTESTHNDQLLDATLNANEKTSSNNWKMQ